MKSQRVNHNYKEKLTNKIKRETYEGGTTTRLNHQRQPNSEATARVSKSKENRRQSKSTLQPQRSGCTQR